jgi:MFS family permease
MSEQRAARLAAASIVGTTLEYFDFAVYNTLAALLFNRLFFPNFDPLSGAMLAFSTFAVGYLARPVGGLIFGRLGDRRGRRYVLVATLVTMGAATVLMGVLPTYAAAGIASPILLVSLRFVQGVAYGGEWAGAVLLPVEHGDQRRRGLNSAWAQMGPSIGTLIATGSVGLLTFTLSSDAFESWGWRLPFLSSVLLIAFGLWVRLGVAETPLFARLEAEQAKSRAPVSEVFRKHWRTLIRAGSVRIGADVFYSLTVAFSLTYLTTTLGVSRTVALTALSIGSALNALAMPYFGALSDRIGRRVVGGIGAVLAAVWAFALFPLFDTRQTGAIILALAVGLFVHAMLYGTQAAFIAEQFPTRVRYAGSSLAYTLAGVVGGGIAPLVLTALLKWTNSTLVLSLYALVALAVTGAALLFTRELSAERLE